MSLKVQKSNMEGLELVVETKALSQPWPLKHVKNQVQGLVRKTWLQLKYQIKAMTIRFFVKIFQIIQVQLERLSQVIQRVSRNLKDIISELSGRPKH